MTSRVEEPVSMARDNSRGSAAAVAEPSAPRGKKRPPPPEWPAERFFNFIGRVPAAAGRFLDRLARAPFPVGPVVRFFSSVWLGILWLLLIAVYMAIGSGRPTLRAWLDVTSLQYFDAWPMVALLALLSVTLIVVTLRRIPLTLYRAGVWTVHIGIITLIVSCFFYFGLKHEGMVRIMRGQTVGSFYGSTTRALFIKGPVPKAGKTKPAYVSLMAPLRTLPIFRRRDPHNGNGLDLPINLGALAAKNPALKDVAVKIVGYFPYAELAEIPVPRVAGRAPKIPAMRVGLSSGNLLGGKWIAGGPPADQIQRSDAGLFDMEYLFHPSREKQREIETAFTAKRALTVIVPGDHVDRTYPLVRGKTIVVAGTPYTITPLKNLGQMPMVTKGYRGAASSAYMVGVSRVDAGGKIFHFERAAVFRFPGKSADFIMKHGRVTPVFARIDHHITIVYQNAAREQLWMIEHKNGACTLVHRAIGGAVNVYPLIAGKPIPLKLDGIPARFELKRLGRLVSKPYTIPRRMRHRHATGGMNKAILRLSVKKPGFRRGAVYVPFQQFGEAGSLRPTEVKVPGVGKLGFVFSNIERPLPSRITLISCKELTRPGTVRMAQDFVSRVRITDKKTGRSRIALIHLNHPANDHGLHYFQARFGRDRNGHGFTVLGVGNTHGVWGMLTGVILIVCGIGYAFYIKPLLLRARKKQLAAYAAGGRGPKEA